MPDTAKYRVELTLWQALAVVIGTLMTIAVKTVFHSFHSKDELLQCLDERLGTVCQLIESYTQRRPVPEEVSDRLALYTSVGGSRLRRILARSRYEQMDRDRLTTVVALVGRFET